MPDRRLLHVHGVQGVERDPSLQVAGPHEVGLVHRAGSGERRVDRVGSPLGDVQGSRAPPRNLGSTKDPVDGPHLGRGDPELLQFPGDRHRAHLGPGVGHQAIPDLEDQTFHPGRRPPGLDVGSSGSLLGPAVVGGVVAPHPLSHPPFGPPELDGHLPRGLSRQHPGDRVFAQPDLVPGHPAPSVSTVGMTVETAVDGRSRNDVVLETRLGRGTM